jgi:arsenite-transporting ATPase
MTNAEKRVVRETQRAFVYFSLHGLTVDRLLVNRMLPDDVRDGFFREWRATQERFLKGIRTLLDIRIQQATGGKAKGEKIKVE